MELIYLLFILVLSIIMFSTSLWIQHKTVYLAPVKGYPQGVKVNGGYAAMRLDSVSTTTGSGIFKTPSSQIYLIIGITIKNISAKPINIFPTTDMYVKDKNGNLTYLSIYDLTNPFRAGELLPGDQISGQLSYLIPKNSLQKFYIDAIWSGGVVVFDVNY